MFLALGFGQRYGARQVSGLGKSRCGAVVACVSALNRVTPRPKQRVLVAFEMECKMPYSTCVCFCESAYLAAQMKLAATGVRSPVLLFLFASDNVPYMI